MSNALRTILAMLLLGIPLTGWAQDADGASQSVRLVRPTHDKFNLHLSVGAIKAFSDDLDTGGFESVGVQGLVGFDVVLVEPLALSFQGGFNTLVAGKGANHLASALVGVGFRLRFFSDDNGPLADGGTAAGNLWLDAHFDYFHHEYEDHGGYDVGLGYEFALFNNVNMGPYARFSHVAIGKGDSIGYMAVSGGLAISIAGDATPRDMDQDGVTDDLDGCPKQPEDADGFDDEDGCPDPDNDGDTVADGDDACPTEAGTADNQGCPVFDQDEDGIADPDDMCPDEPEDADGFEDDDGCADGDNDGDHIADADDKCPMEAEDRDGFADADGCPEEDNDNDGIPDATDTCPNEPETVDGDSDADGCPDHLRVEANAIRPLTPIAFKGRKAALADESLPVLDEVAAVAMYKGMGVAITVHPPTKGNAKRNAIRAELQGQTIVDYLVSKGLAAQAVTHTVGDPSDDAGVTLVLTPLQPAAAPAAPAKEQMPSAGAPADAPSADAAPAAKDAAQPAASDQEAQPDKGD